MIGPVPMSAEETTVGRSILATVTNKTLHPVAGCGERVRTVFRNGMQRGTVSHG